MDRPFIRATQPLRGIVKIDQIQNAVPEKSFGIVTKKEHVTIIVDHQVGPGGKDVARVLLDHFV